MAKRYEITLIDGSYAQQMDAICCGSMPLTKTKKYLQELSKIQDIPQESCLYSVDAKLYNTDNTRVYFNREYPSAKTDNVVIHRLQLTVCNRTGQKCVHGNCFKNISQGKCTDKFMIEIIGKKLFADKYKDNNSKQR